MLKKIKTSLILPILFILFAMPALAVLDSDTDDVNITINYPRNNEYNASSIVNLVLNATVRWAGSSNGRDMNITNGTFYFIVGTNTTTYVNSTVNGSRTSLTGGDFTVNITYGEIAPRTYTVIFEARNASDTASPSSSINSSSITFTIDRTNPVITIQQPNQGQTVSAKGTGLVTIEYTPTDTNLGNSTYYINGVRQTSSTSGTTSPNITSGSRKNTFTKVFGSNNNSVTLRVEITDLAGLKTNSSTITFNVFREGSTEPFKVFVTPSGEVISSPAEPKGKTIQKSPTGNIGKTGNIGNIGGLLSNPFVWGGAIIVAVGLFIWWQNKKK